MSDPGAPVVYSFGKMDSADDAYYSDMTSDISSVMSGPSHSCRQHSSYQKHHRYSKYHEQQMAEGGVGVMESHYDKENSSPDSDDPQSGNIFSFMRSGSGKVVLNKGTSLPTELEDLEGESCDCHCSACCSCHIKRIKQGCYGHNCVCKKMSDGTECQNSINKDLPSPTAIDSWGHFSKHKRNHYKYRRSDYSSESEDENTSLGKKSMSNVTLLAKQKSHLPSITLTRQTSASSSQSFEKPSSGSIDEYTFKEGVKPVDFKERVKVCKYCL
jgi:hypothetical protein